LRIGFVAVLAAAVLGLVTNDSGPIVVALMLVYLGPFVALLALAAPRAGAASAAGAPTTTRTPTSLAR